jgi:hypothetical protein
MVRLPTDLYSRPRRYSANNQQGSSRLSSGASDASSLHRTSSTTSNASTSASSVSSTEARPADKQRRVLHRRTVSGNSFHLPRSFQPFHKKAQSQPNSTSEQQRQLPPPPPPPPQQRPRQPPPRPRRPSEEALRCKEPHVTLPTARPSATQWQCSDLVVRCKSDVYHVDSTIMCYHSKWFARICAIMKSPVGCRL